MGKKKNNVDAQDRIQITSEISGAARVYKEYLVGKTFMYVFNNECIEVIFKKNHFMHLTGVYSKLPTLQFYTNALKGTLRHQQISFNDRYPYHLSVKKVGQLLNIEQIISTDLYILKDINTQTATYKFGILDMQFTLCVCEDKELDGTLRSELFVPVSLRIEDSTQKGTDLHPVSLIFEKPNSQMLYTKTLYTDNTCKITELPEGIKSKLDIPLLLGVTNSPQEEILKNPMVI